MMFVSQPVLAFVLLLVSFASLSSAMCSPMGSQSDCVYSGDMPTTTSTDAPVAVAAAADMTTVSAAAHPLLLYGLQHYASASETAITYGSPPTASAVPGHPACYGLPSGSTCPYSETSEERRRNLRAARRSPWLNPSPSPLFEGQVNPSQPDETPFPDTASATSPPSTSSRAPAGPLLAKAAAAAPAPGGNADSYGSLTTTAGTVASSSTCTQITGSSPTATAPSLCHPSHHVNAGGLVASGTTTAGGGGGLAVASTTVAVVANKVDCCAACAGILNCVAWSFVPAATQAATPPRPGGFDPWARGGCVVAYQAGGSSTTDETDTPAVCPNGAVGSVLDTATTDNATTGRGWDNVYYNGWNEGPCGAPAAGWDVDGKDAGTGDAVCQ